MASVSAPWFLFSWMKFGSAVPDTLIIKLEQKAWTGGYTFGDLLKGIKSRPAVGTAPVSERFMLAGL